MVGEHRVNVTVQGQATAGSPYSAKVNSTFNFCRTIKFIVLNFLNQVYDVNAIKVKNVTNGSVGRPVTFLVETAQAGPGNL